MAKRILLVDDDPGVTRAFGRALESLGGYEVRAENDGRRAIEVALEFRPDLILLDVIGVEWDGESIAVALEGDPDVGGIPVAFLSALVTKNDVHERSVIDARGRPLLPKTLGARGLVAAVDALLRGAERSDDGTALGSG